MVFKHITNGGDSKDHVEIRASDLSVPVVTYLIAVRKWRLEQPFTYRDEDTRITVPDQFEFDLASIPRPFWGLIAPFELSISAPLVHDFIYHYRGEPPIGSIIPPRIYTRRQADILFRSMMKEEGVWWWRRTAAYCAVRSFGWKAWR